VFPLHLLFLILLGIPALFFLIYLNVVALSFEVLGLSSQGAFFLFALSLMGSVINIPVASREVITRRPLFSGFPFFFYYPPMIEEQVIAVNLGGALIPSAFSLYLLPRSNLIAVILSTVTVSLVCYYTARAIPGRGILIPTFIPPLAAALSALVFSSNNPSVTAYIAGTVGTLIGADLLHLKEILRMGPGVLSIGGAGVYDGIFFAGFVAAFLTR